MAITKIQAGALPADVITTAAIDDASVTHAKLHTTMDLSSKTVTLPSAITDTITNKLPLAGGTLTGTLSAPLVSVSTSVAKVAEFNSTHTNHGYMVFKEDGADKFYLGASTAVSGQSGHYTFYTSSGIGLDFNTGGAGSPRMRIDSSGNVGIGETVPLGKLHIKAEDTGATADSVGNLLVLEGTTNGLSILSSTSGAGYILFGDADDTAHGGIGYDHSSGAMRFRTGSTWDQMKILADGNVGIGSDSPGAKLTITDENSGQAMLQVRNFSTSATGSFGNDHSAEFRSATSTTTHGVLIHHNENAIGRRTLDVSDNNGIFASFVQGKVGIGTTGPNATLEVRNSTTATDSIIASAGLVTAGHYHDLIVGDGPNYAVGLRRYITQSNPSWLRPRLDFIVQNANTYLPADRQVRMSISDTGAVSVPGSLSKGSGSFKIDHPLPSKTETHNLVHSFVESPQANNIYRGKVVLVDGSATINIDTVSGMTDGTYVLLNTNTQCFTSNETGWTAVKGSVSGNTLTINSEVSCTDTISWMVIGERHDQHMIDTDWTNEEGQVIVEPLKEE